MFIFSKYSKSFLFLNVYKKKLNMLLNVLKWLLLVIYCKLFLNELIIAFKCFFSKYTK